MMKTNEHLIVLFDGYCNLCNSSVNFLLDRDKSDIFRFGSLQSDEGVRLLDQHKIDRTITDSVVLIADGKAFTHSDAALKIARGLGGLWSISYALIVIPKFLRDPVYRFIAANRYKWFGKREMCRMPLPEEKKKFI